MLTMLEVEPELACKIQARARVRGLSVDVHFRESIDEKGTEPKEVVGLARKNELPCCDSGPRATAATRRFFLTMQLVAKASTQRMTSFLPAG